jgi:hypothetical protein
VVEGGEDALAVLEIEQVQPARDVLRANKTRKMRASLLTLARQRAPRRQRAFAVLSAIKPRRAVYPGRGRGWG